MKQKFNTLEEVLDFKQQADILLGLPDNTGTLTYCNIPEITEILNEENEVIESYYEIEITNELDFYLNSKGKIEEDKIVYYDKYNDEHLEIDFKPIIFERVDKIEVEFLENETEIIVYLPKVIIPLIPNYPYNFDKKYKIQSTQIDFLKLIEDVPMFAIYRKEKPIEVFYYQNDVIFYVDRFEIGHKELLEFYLGEHCIIEQ